MSGTCPNRLWPVSTVTCVIGGGHAGKHRMDFDVGWVGIVQER